MSANAVTALHIFWTTILFGGAVFVFFAHWYAWWQIATIGFTLLIALPFGGVCPLTKLEDRLRKKVDPKYSNHGAYLMTYLNKVFGTHFSKQKVGIAIGIFYVFSCAVSILFLTTAGK